MPSYVYQLIFKKTDQIYIGARKCKIDPADDLWIKYFSSSKLVKKMIKIHGNGSFDYQILKTFETFNEALDYELLLLSSANADKNELYLNQSIPGKTFRSRVRLPETNEKIRKALKGRPNPRRGLKGVPCSEEKRKKLSIASKLAHERKRQASGNTGYKPKEPKIKLTKNPKQRNHRETLDNWKNRMSFEPSYQWYNKRSGESFYGNRRQLKEKDPSIYVPELGWVIKGKVKSHRGWTIQKVKSHL